ncbi:MAG: hypothetical protein ACRD9R_24610, partial [Pyrinomonadaceae bacterium]
MFHFRRTPRDSRRFLSLVLTYLTLIATLPQPAARAESMAQTSLRQAAPTALTATPAKDKRQIRPAALQPNGKIAFVSGRDGDDEIYVMDADGVIQALLTDNAAGDINPAFSPDGKKIAFTSDRDGQFEIYVMDADGSNQTRLTTDPAADGQPSWSPDGTKIVFFSARDGNNEIYLMNADGSGGPTRLTNDAGSDTNPAFSPDGAKIVFETDRTVDAEPEIFVMNADGTDPVNRSNDPGEDVDPAWSPDGTQLSFSSRRDSGAEIYTMNADGTNVVRRTNNNADIIDEAPTWSPDGTKIAYRSNEVGDGNVHVLDLTGSGGDLQLTFDPASDGEPTWMSLFECLPPPAGMVAWYPGDGNADNLVGVNNGTLQNGATFAPGKVGQAFSFDGVD